MMGLLLVPLMQLVTLATLPVRGAPVGAYLYSLKQKALDEGSA
jgi:hypothetical protein